MLQPKTDPSLQVYNYLKGQKVSDLPDSYAAFMDKMSGSEEIRRAVHGFLEQKNVQDLPDFDGFSNHFSGAPAVSAGPATEEGDPQEPIEQLEQPEPEQATESRLGGMEAQRELGSGLAASLAEYRMDPKEVDEVERITRGLDARDPLRKLGKLISVEGKGGIYQGKLRPSELNPPLDAAYFEFMQEAALRDDFVAMRRTYGNMKENSIDEEDFQGRLLADPSKSELANNFLLPTPEELSAAEGLFVLPPEVSEQTGVTGGGSMATLMPDADPDQRVRAYYNLLLDEYQDLAERTNIDYEKKPRFRPAPEGGVLSGVAVDKEIGSQLERKYPGGYSLTGLLDVAARLVEGRTPAQMRQLQVVSELAALSPIVLNKVNPVDALTPNGGISASFKDMFGLPAADDSQMAQITLRALANAGVRANSGAEAAIRKEAELTMGEKTERLIGSSTAIMVQMAATAPLGGSLGKAISSPIDKIRRGSKLGNWGLNTARNMVEAGVRYEVGGQLGTDRMGEELNFGSGLFGGLGQGIFSAPIAAYMNKANREVTKWVARRVGSGMGEMGEETFQEVHQTLTRNNMDFSKAKEDFEKNFGSLSDAGFFFISSFLMGMAMGGGDIEMDGSKKEALDDFLVRARENVPEAELEFVDSITEELVKSILEDSKTDEALAQIPKDDPSLPDALVLEEEGDVSVDASAVEKTGTQEAAPQVDQSTPIAEQVKEAAETIGVDPAVEAALNEQAPVEVAESVEEQAAEVPVDTEPVQEDALPSVSESALEDPGQKKLANELDAAVQQAQEEDREFVYAALSEGATTQDIAQFLEVDMEEEFALNEDQVQEVLEDFRTRHTEGEALTTQEVEAEASPAPEATQEESVEEGLPEAETTTPTEDERISTLTAAGPGREGFSKKEAAVLIKDLDSEGPISAEGAALRKDPRFKTALSQSKNKPLRKLADALHRKPTLRQVQRKEASEKRKQRRNEVDKVLNPSGKDSKKSPVASARKLHKAHKKAIEGPGKTSFRKRLNKAISMSSLPQAEGATPVSAVDAFNAELAKTESFKKQYDELVAEIEEVTTSEQARDFGHSTKKSFAEAVASQLVMDSSLRKKGTFTSQSKDNRVVHAADEIAQAFAKASNPASTPNDFSRYAPSGNLITAAGPGSEPSRFDRIPPALITGVAPRKLRDVLQRLKRGVNLSLFISRPRIKTARGSYERRQDVMKISSTTNLNVVSHELGHVISSRFGLVDEDISPSVISELLDLSTTGSPPPEGSGAALQYRLEEGFAEFMAFFVVNPEATAAEFPATYEHYMSNVPARVRTAVDRFSIDTRTLLGATANERFGAIIMDPPATEKEAKERLAGTGVATKTTTVTLSTKARIEKLGFFGYMNVKYFDAMAPVFDAFNRMLVAQGLGTKNALGAVARDWTQINPSHDVLILARNFLGWMGRITAMFEGGMEISRGEIGRDTPTGDVVTLPWILGAMDNTDGQTVQNEKSQTSRYMIAKRVMAKFERQIPTPPPSLPGDTVIENRAFRMVGNRLYELKRDGTLRTTPIPRSSDIHRFIDPDTAIHPGQKEPAGPPPPASPGDSVIGSKAFRPVGGRVYELKRDGTLRSQPIPRSSEIHRHMKPDKPGALPPPTIAGDVVLGASAFRLIGDRVYELNRDGEPKAHPKAKSSKVHQYMDPPNAIFPGKKNQAKPIPPNGGIQPAEQPDPNQVLAGAGLGYFRDIDQARQTLAEFEELRISNPQQHARIMESARRYEVLAEMPLKYMVAEGRMTQDELDRIKSENEFYVAMHRIMSSDPDDPGMGMGGSSGGISAVKNPLKQFEGSERIINDPYMNVMAAANRIYKETDRNAILRAFVEMGQFNREDGDPAIPEGVRGLAEDVTAAFDEQGLDSPQSGMPDSKDVVTVYIDGHRRFYKLDSEIHRAFTTMYSYGQSVPWAMSAFSNLLKQTITLAPTFAIRNFIRDTLTRLAGVTATNGRIPILSDALEPFLTVKELWNSEHREAFERYGGSQGGYYNADPGTYYLRMFQGLGAGGGNWSTAGAKVRKGFRAYENILSRFENANRLREFARAKREGIEKWNMSETEANLFAAHRAKDLMDFAVGGELGLWINKVIPFFNPWLQGMKRTFQAARTNPARFMALYTAYSLFPTLALRLMVHMMGADDKYEQEPNYMRDTYFLIPRPDGEWFKVPKPHDIGVLSTGAERTMSALFLGEEHPYDGYAASIAQMITKPEVIYGPFPPLVESMTNYNFFRQKHIEPLHEEGRKLKKKGPDGKKVWAKKGAATASVVSKTVSSALEATGWKWLEWDPRKIDNVLLGSFGYIGDYTIRATNTLFGSGEELRAYDSFGDFVSRLSGVMGDNAYYTANDVQWVQNFARYHTMERYPEYQEYKAVMNQLFESKPEHRKASGEQLVRTASRIRKEWERLNLE